MMSGSETQVALARLVDCSKLVGNGFCNALVGALADTLSVPTVLIATIDRTNPKVAQTVSAWNDGSVSDNFTYDLLGSPCSNVMSGGAMCVYPNGVAELFPQDTLLVDMGACGYIGVPLLSHNGETVGVLAALSDSPIELEPWMGPIIEIFAGRVAAELERENSITQAEYLGRLVEGSASEIYVFDSKTLNFILVNKGARDNLGYSMAELRTLTPIDLKPDLTRDAFEALIEPVNDAKCPILTFKTRHRRKDGSLYPVEVNLQLLQQAGATVYYAAIEDITQRTQIEAELSSAQWRLERIFAQSAAGIIEADADGRMTLVNEAWCKMLGYREEELLDKTIFEVTHPDSILATQSAMTKLLGGAPSVTIEKTYARKDGGVINARSNVSAIRSDDGQFLGVAAVVSDITDRIENEQRLRASEERTRNIMDRSMALIGVLDPDGTLKEANAAAMMTADLSPSDVIGKKFWDCHWWSHDPQVMKRLETAVGKAATGETVRYDEVIRVKNDERMTIDFMLSPSLRADGSVDFLVPTAVDITERKKQEIMVNSLMREVNHRSKNLLAVVQAIAGMMPYHSAKDFQKSFSQRLQSLAACQDLLVHSGWSNISLEPLIGSQLSHFADLLEYRITIQGPEVEISASSAQPLGMAIYELATNAVKHGSLSNDVGKVLISWSAEVDDKGESDLRLIWRESGGPKTAKPESSGFGSTVLSGIVTASLNGQSRSSWEPSGLTWELRCPLEALRRE